jgi:hypothetical protein
MPILANALIERIDVDRDRYLGLINRCKYAILMKEGDDTYRAYETKDPSVPGLEDCRLLIVTLNDRDIIYSCYFKVVEHPFFGSRVVQVEVRSDEPGTARFVMQRFFLKHYGALRTDISHTPAGRKMWERFIETNQCNFYIADLPIDANTELGRRNQDANNVEQFYHLRRLTTDDVIWHDNRRGNVSVIYATNASIL